MEVLRESLLVCCQFDYPEYQEFLAAWLRELRQRPRINGEYDGITSLLAGLESGLGVATVTTRTTRLFLKRVRLKLLSTQTDPHCIAAGHWTERVDDKRLAVSIEKQHSAAETLT